MPVSYGAGAVIDAFGGIDQIDAKKVSIAAMFQITVERHIGFRWSPALRPGSQIIVLRVPEQMYDPVTQLVGLNFHVIDVPTQVTHEKRQVGGKP